MSGMAVDRSVAGRSVELRAVRTVRRNTIHGRQGKSAASGWAHVVGRVAYFRHRGVSACWRLHAKVQGIQCPERRRSTFASSVLP